MRSTIRRLSAAASSGPATPDWMMANSSPPKPRDGVVGPHALPKSVGDLDQQQIAEGVAERVVHFLEVIEIEAQHGDLAGCRGDCPRRPGRDVRETAPGSAGR